MRERALLPLLPFLVSCGADPAKVPSDPHPEESGEPCADDGLLDGESVCAAEGAVLRCADGIAEELACGSGTLCEEEEANAATCACQNIEDGTCPVDCALDPDCEGACSEGEESCEGECVDPALDHNYCGGCAPPAACGDPVEGMLQGVTTCFNGGCGGMIRATGDELIGETCEALCAATSYAGTAMSCVSKCTLGESESWNESPEGGGDGGIVYMGHRNVPTEIGCDDPIPEYAPGFPDMAGIGDNGVVCCCQAWGG